MAYVDEGKERQPKQQRNEIPKTEATQNSAKVPKYWYFSLPVAGNIHFTNTCVHKMLVVSDKKSTTKAVKERKIKGN